MARIVLALALRGLYPGTTLTSGSFGRITGAGSPRILQMALKLNF